MRSKPTRVATVASRLPYRNRADADRRRRVAERGRNLRRSRSEKIVTNSVAFQEQAEPDAVIANGYVGVSGAGAGLGTPWLAMPMQPVGVAGTALTCGPYGIERATTSAAFETLFRHESIRQNVLWRPRLVVRCSDGTTAGEVQAVDLDTGLPLTVFAGAAWLAAIPTGVTTDTALGPGVSLVAPVAWGESMRLGIQARRTAGAGSITLSVIQSIGG